MTVALSDVTAMLTVFPRERLLCVSVWKDLLGMDACVLVRAKAEDTTVRNAELQAFFLLLLTKNLHKDLSNQEI